MEPVRTLAPLLSVSFYPFISYPLHYLVQACSHEDRLFLGTRHTRYYWLTIIIVLESGAIYTLALMGDLVAYALNSPAALITVAVLDQVVVSYIHILYRLHFRLCSSLRTHILQGIVPTSIIILSALSREYQSSDITNTDINTVPSVRSANVRPALVVYPRPQFGEGAVGRETADVEPIVI